MYCVCLVFVRFSVCAFVFACDGCGGVFLFCMCVLCKICV